jgi:hypothetical protein
MKGGDLFQHRKRLWLRLHEKGGKRHEVPCHPELEGYLAKYRIELAQRVIGRNVVFKSELIKQLLRRVLASHHRPFLRCSAGQTES